MIHTKPEWLKKKLDLSFNHNMENMLKKYNLNTVCRSASCPNRSECFADHTATFMIMGNICTRECKFCGITKGLPLALDENEPKNIAEAVSELNLKYVVITCVTRDDLKDAGVEHFARVVNAIHAKDRNIQIEILTSDFYSAFCGGEDRENLLLLNLQKMLACDLAVFGHNIETIKRIYDDTRVVSSYDRSLNVLKTVKKIKSDMLTKTSFMLGMGENLEEIENSMKDLRNVGCDIVTFGQYLAPSKKHYPVQRYVELSEFKFLEQKAFEMGFRGVYSGPYVRSSYKAKTCYNLARIRKFPSFK